MRLFGLLARRSGLGDGNRQIADLKCISLGELAEATTANFFDLFDRAERPAE